VMLPLLSGRLNFLEVHSISSVAYLKMLSAKKS
jgi:hypothetical protein